MAIVNIAATIVGGAKKSQVIRLCRCVWNGRRIPPQFWFNYLDHENRIRSRLTTDERGWATIFALQLEILIEDEWTPVVRYDNAHDEVHIDYINPDGVTYDKVWLNIHAPFNTAFTLAENDLKASYLDHRARFIRQLERNQP